MAEAVIYCPQCGCELKPADRIAVDSTKTRYRRFKCTSLSCEHIECIKATGGNALWHQGYIEDVRKEERRRRPNAYKYKPG